MKLRSPPTIKNQAGCRKGRGREEAGREGRRQEEEGGIGKEREGRKGG